jgi:nucleoid-associated protein YgaU
MDEGKHEVDKQPEEEKQKSEEQAVKEPTKIQKEISKQKEPSPQEKITVTGKEEGVRKHTVLEGETIRSIAMKYYGDEKYWIDIYNANKDKIKKGRVAPGEILVIP